MSLSVQADPIKYNLININHTSESYKNTGIVDIHFKGAFSSLMKRYPDTTARLEQLDLFDEYPSRVLELPEEFVAEFNPHREDIEKNLLPLSVLVDGKKEPMKLSLKSMQVEENKTDPRQVYINIYYKTQLPEGSIVDFSYDKNLGDSFVSLTINSVATDSATVAVPESSYKGYWSKSPSDKVSFKIDGNKEGMPFFDVVSQYIDSGIAHIVPMGLDHILFIIGIFLFSLSFRPLLLQVTMFTVAHTITLGMAMNGMVSVDPLIVEPLIALSIAYIAIENIFLSNISRHRLLLIFVFGLLHGLGFASVLSEFGMPSDQFVTALISFNIGVEIAQVGILLACYFLLGKLFGHRSWYRKVIVIPISLVIGLVALYWVYDRVDIGYLIQLL